MSLLKVFAVKDAKITVTHWKPGILATNENGVSIDNVFDNLLKEASSKLRKSENQSRGETFQFNAMKKDEVIQNRVRRRKSFSTPLSKSMWNDVRSLDLATGESRVNILSPDGHIYAAKVKDSTLDSCGRG